MLSTSWGAVNPFSSRGTTQGTENTSNSMDVKLECVFVSKNCSSLRLFVNSCFCKRITISHGSILALLNFNRETVEVVSIRQPRLSNYTSQCLSPPTSFYLHLSSNLHALDWLVASISATLEYPVPTWAIIFLEWNSRRKPINLVWSPRSINRPSIEETLLVRGDRG